MTQEKSLEEYERKELVECAKDLISELDWLVRACEDEDYRLHREINVAQAVYDVKYAQKEFNRAMRAYNKVAGFIAE